MFNLIRYCEHESEQDFWKLRDSCFENVIFEYFFVSQDDLDVLYSQL